MSAKVKMPRNVRLKSAACYEQIKKHNLNHE